MQYKVLKSGLDGISGGDSLYASIDEVLREISYHRGWDNLKQLHNAIRRWSNDVEPGSVFATQASAIIAIGVGRSLHADDLCTECGHEGMDYTELEPVEGGDFEQDVSCPGCGGRWRDVYVLADRHRLFSKEEQD